MDFINYLANADLCMRLSLFVSAPGGRYCGDIVARFNVCCFIDVGTCSKDSRTYIPAISL